MENSSLPATTDNNTQLAPTRKGIMKDEYSGTSMAELGETSTSAMAAAAEAEVKARYAIAYSRPRDMETVRVKLLAACKQPGFAAITRYCIPNRGEGWTIGFAEEARRQYGNLHIRTECLYDDQDKVLYRIAVTDLEANNAEEDSILINKTVERSRFKEGQKLISTRTNSEGKITYEIRATDDEFRGKRRAETQRLKRTLILANVPRHILDDCLKEVNKTLAAKHKEDPLAANKLLADSFAELGIMPADLKAYLGHNFEQMDQDEYLMLRMIYAAVRDRETHWSEFVKEKTEAAAGEEGEQATPLADKFKEKISQAKARAKAPAAATTTEQPPANGHGPAKSEPAREASAPAADTTSAPSQGDAPATAAAKYADAGEEIIDDTQLGSSAPPPTAEPPAPAQRTTRRNLRGL